MDTTRGAARLTYSIRRMLTSTVGMGPRWPAVAALTLLVACGSSWGGDPAMEAAPSGAGHAELSVVPIPIPIPPHRYPSPSDLVEITAGDYHTCARRFDGRTYCWGLATSGQTGTSPSLGCSGCVPQPTQIPNLYWVVQVEAGSFHTCARVAGGAAYCWGNGQNGQLGGGQPGAGIYGNSTAPQLVSGGHVFSSIAAGADSTCGSTSGGIYCWGGIGGQGNPLPYPTGSSIPTLIASGAAYTSMTVGREYACGMVIIPGVASEVGCFGLNQYGQAGSDPLAWPWVPLDGGTSLGGAVSRVSAEYDLTCADQQNGTVQCFGDGTSGQLGNGGRASTYQAQTVLTSALQPAQLAGVSAGVDHACALSPGGAAFCWGNGLSGQLGNAMAAGSSTAVPVSGGLTFRGIAAGRNHTCAIGTDNHIYCWGDNTYGQLGIGSAGSWWSSPVLAVDPP